MKQIVKLCPQCSAPVHVKALVDSDDRTYLTWNFCEQCGWDSRPAERLRQSDYAKQIVFKAATLTPADRS